MRRASGGRYGRPGDGCGVRCPLAQSTDWNGTSDTGSGVLSWQRERGGIGLRYLTRSAVVECVIARQKICLASRGGVVARYNLTVSASWEEIVCSEFVLNHISRRTIIHIRYSRNRTVAYSPVTEDNWYHPHLIVGLAPRDCMVICNLQQTAPPEARISTLKWCLSSRLYFCTLLMESRRSTYNPESELPIAGASVAEAPWGLH